MKLSIFQAQTEIMKWLRSLGHQTVEDEKEMRGCTMKRRYASEPPLPNMSMRAYPCPYCQGWHLTSQANQ
jgi:hypothetical protein